MLGENAAAVHMRLFHAHASIVQVNQSESLRGQQIDPCAKTGVAFCARCICVLYLLGDCTGRGLSLARCAQNHPDNPLGTCIAKVRRRQSKVRLGVGFAEDVNQGTCPSQKTTTQCPRNPRILHTAFGW